MSATVTYKGNTLTTVNNETKVLNTSGTWLEDNITITDIGGGSALVVDTPDSHGGTIREITAQNEVVLQAQKTITPASSQQTVLPDTGYDGFASVIIEAATGGLDYTVREVTVTGNSPTVTRDFTNFIFIAQVAEDELPTTRPNTNAYYLEFVFVDGNFIRKSGNKAFAIVTNSTNYYNGAGTNAANLSVGSTSITFTTYTSQIMYPAKWKVLQIELPTDYPLYSFYPLS